MLGDLGGDWKRKGVEKAMMSATMRIVAPAFLRLDITIVTAVGDTVPQFK